MFSFKSDQYIHISFFSQRKCENVFNELGLEKKPVDTDTASYLTLFPSVLKTQLCNLPQMPVKRFTFKFRTLRRKSAVYNRLSLATLL